MTPDMLACNAVGGFSRDFWAEIDNQVLQLRDQEVGMEIVNDLIGVQTVLPVGKTAKLYNVVGDIADDVSVSIDGQAPFSFDHTDYASDGDPIPVFTAGYGVNWRHAAGLNSVGIDLVLDSQMAKMRKFNQKRVNYYLNGDSKIQVQSYPAQGIKNHRNTKKINLGSGAGGANIDLTTSDMTALFAFFGIESSYLWFHLSGSQGGGKNGPVTIKWWAVDDNNNIVPGTEQSLAVNVKNNSGDQDYVYYTFKVLPAAGKRRYNSTSENGSHQIFIFLIV
jgi:hypothetical protein